ncbi:hypothetical protein [Nocardia fusca]|uniref:hypothetical protein n=1 Tax=Nocardia fusca TaxID=941183 RepID=UPI0007A75BD4|nr:hypothetical protein [Nocardia fusca]
MGTEDFDDFDHAVGGGTHSHPTDAATSAAAPIRRVGIGVYVVIMGLLLLLATIFGANHEYELDRRLEYQECVTQEQARIARDGSLLQPQDFCDIYPGR